MSASGGLLAARAGTDATGRPSDRSQPAPALWAWWVWLLVCAAVIAVSVCFVRWSNMRPSFDGFGWLTWAKVILRGGRLNLNAAPSWKPLPFLFTLPYSLFGAASVQMWSVTATAGTIFMGVFAGRIVYRLAGVGRGDPRLVVGAAWVAALFAGVGELGMERMPTLTYIANSDQLNTAFLLAAVDAHLSHRWRLAYLALFFAALGRPEVWFIIGVYGLWMIRRVPGTRGFVLGGWGLVIAAWFVPDVIWAKSAVQAGTLDLHRNTAIRGDKVIGVLNRWVLLYEWPMQLAALLGVAIGCLRRDRRIIVLLGCVLFWLVVEITFAYHGWSAVYRYLIEPAAVMIVIAGDGMFRLLSAGRGGLEVPAGRVAAIAGPLVVLGILIALVPFARHREERWRAGYSTTRRFGVINRNLSRAVDRAGRRRAILRCGEIAAISRYQSQLAWAAGINVAQVQGNPALLLRRHRNVVLFTRRHLGWTVRAYNVPASRSASCAMGMSVTVPSS